MAAYPARVRRSHRLFCDLLCAPPPPPLFAAVRGELAQQITKVEALTSPHSGRVSRQLKHFPINPEVSITADTKGRHTLSIVAGDRPGLLARIAYVLARHNIDLRSAKINTLGARAEDTFHITGTELIQLDAVAALRDELLRQVA